MNAEMAGKCAKFSALDTDKFANFRAAMPGDA
jgi:hypothetical protein